MSTKTHQTWNQVKGKIITKFGTLTAASAAIGASTEAIRLTVKGKCPHVAKRLEAALR
ncbi:MAG TPA: hypothetical protein VK961_06815 [Chthoniobacter sp.]|nr:hypothetical protein [Chthoniobacter sp.]